MRNLLLLVLALGVPIPARAQDRPYQRQAREIFERLISYRTAAGHGQVPAMADYIAEVLIAGGTPAHDIVRLPHGETLAMLVRVPGRDPAARPLLFSGHMDVVDARPEDWVRDPFTLIEEDGFFFGRGTADNKAGITGLVSTILRLRADGHQPARTLVFAFVGDEETGMATTRLVAAHEWVRNAEYAINTDAGGGGMAEDGRALDYGVQGAEKTYATYRLTARNPGGHSSRPRPDNAIYQLAEALLRVRDIAFPTMWNPVSLASLESYGTAVGGEEGQLLLRFVANPEDTAAAAAVRRLPGLDSDLATTCVATMLDAGHAENALPQRAEARVNCRIFPGSTVEEVHAALVAAAADTTIAVEVVGTPVVSPASEPRADVMTAIARSIHTRYPGLRVIPYLEAGGTDGLVYRNAGIPTWGSSGIFMKPSDMFFHGLNERIPVDGFYFAIDHVYALARELGGQ